MSSILTSLAYNRNTPDWPFSEALNHHLESLSFEHLDNEADWNALKTMLHSKGLESPGVPKHICIHRVRLDSRVSRRLDLEFVFKNDETMIKPTFSTAHSLGNQDAEMMRP